MRLDEKMVIFSDRNIKKGIFDHFPKKNSFFQLFNGEMSISDQIYKKNDFQMSFFKCKLTKKWWFSQTKMSREAVSDHFFDKNSFFDYFMKNSRFWSKFMGKPIMKWTFFNVNWRKNGSFLTQKFHKKSFSMNFCPKTEKKEIRYSSGSQYNAPNHSVTVNF